MWYNRTPCDTRSCSVAAYIINYDLFHYYLHCLFSVLTLAIEMRRRKINCESFELYAVCDKLHALYFIVIAWINEQVWRLQLFFIIYYIATFSSEWTAAAVQKKFEIEASSQQTTRKCFAPFIYIITVTLSHRYGIIDITVYIYFFPQSKHCPRWRPYIGRYYK